MSRVFCSLLSCTLIASSGCYEYRTLEPDASDGNTGASGGRAQPPAPAPSCSERAPAQNPGDALCPAGLLELNCVMGPPRIPCPASFEAAVQLACGTGKDDFETHCNACGGPTVRVRQDTFLFEIDFDAKDRLQGVTLIHSAPVGPCEQNEFVFGRRCSPVSASERDTILSCADVGSTLPR